MITFYVIFFHYHFHKCHSLTGPTAAEKSPTFEDGNRSYNKDIVEILWDRTVYSDVLDSIPDNIFRLVDGF
jgi:hypothetical protein